MRTTEIISFRNYVSIGDGIHDDTRAIQQAINDAYLNKSYFVRGTPGDNYKVKSINLKEGSYDFKGVSFISDSLISGNNYVINCEVGVTANVINLTIQKTNTIERAIYINSNSNIESIEVISTVQHSNSNDLLDSAVIINGTNIHISKILVLNFDNSVCL